MSGDRPIRWGAHAWVPIGSPLTHKIYLYRLTANSKRTFRLPVWEFRPRGRSGTALPRDPINSPLTHMVYLLLFLGKTPCGVLPLYDDRRRRRRRCSYKVRQSSISRTVSARIAKFCRHIPADLPYICTRYDIINNFRSEDTAEKTSENAASDGFGSNSSGAAFASAPIGGLLVELFS